MAKFKTRARAIDMLGRQQIANISTAISELFKNSYDAYADNIEADYFRYNNLLVLRDDGFGMTEKEFTDRWLAVGTESKYGKGGGMKSIPPPSGKKARPMMGEKGIGRLAISTIGSQVLILSRASRGKGFSPTVAAFLNWRLFESPGIDLDEIEIPVIPYPVGTLPDRSDVLTLVELFRENIIKLKKNIPSNLQTEILEDLKKFDFDPNETDDRLKSLSLKESGGKVDLSLLGSKTGTHFYILPTSGQLATEIDETPEGGGSPPLIKTLIGFTNTMKFPSEKIGSDSEKDKRGEKIEESIRTAFRDHKKIDLYEDLINSQDFFTLDDFNLTDHLVEGGFDEIGNFEGTVKIYNKDSLPHIVSKPKGIIGNTKCGPFKIKFGYVQGNPSDSKLSKSDFTKITLKLDKIGGLYVYKDNIRVQPYGNYDNDYLGLEFRRSKGAAYYFFSYRRLFGYVEINKEENSELAEKAGREGFIDNEAYKQFRRLLVNLFLQLATDFFRAEGKDLAGYQETKAEMQEAEKIRSTVKKRNDQTRTKLRTDLTRLIEKFDSEIPDRDVEQAVDEFLGLLNSLEEDVTKDEFAEAVLKLEKKYENKLKTIRNKNSLKKPRVGLDERLRKSWEYYRNKFSTFESTILRDAQASIQNASQQALSTREVTSALEKWIINNSTQQIDEENNSFKKDFIKTKNSVSRLLNEIEKINQDFGKKSQSLSQELREQLIRGKESSFHDAFKKFSHGLENLSKEKILLLTIAEEKLFDLENILQGNVEYYGTEETIAAWEEQNLDLGTRYDENLELAQLGMSVSVIGHEFASTINDMRRSIQRLGNWAEEEPELNDLFQSLKTGFEHLDEYLSMFTPLQRRLYRSKVDIEGSSIVSYLRRIFFESLRDNKIKLEATSQFSKTSITGYPSTFYPVFINLVDNAIYWLRDASEPRKIILDAKKDGTIIVADTGPGVHSIDREDIFKPGVSRKPGGRGLGLAISREVLERAEYDLVLDDQPEQQGARFLIRPKSSE